MKIGIPRIAVIVALLLGGLLVLSQSFPGSSTASPGKQEPQETQSPTPSVTQPTPTQITPASQGVEIAIFNGAGIIGLAGRAQEDLLAQGYVATQQPDNSPVTNLTTSTVYYQASSGVNAEQAKADAEFAAENFMPAGTQVSEYDAAGAALPIGSRQPELIVVLGSDYDNYTP